MEVDGTGTKSDRRFSDGHNFAEIPPSEGGALVLVDDPSPIASADADGHCVDETCAQSSASLLIRKVIVYHGIGFLPRCGYPCRRVKILPG